MSPGVCWSPVSPKAVLVSACRPAVIVQVLPCELKTTGAPEPVTVITALLRKVAICYSLFVVIVLSGLIVLSVDIVKTFLLQVLPSGRSTEILDRLLQACWVALT